jgi:hypothetical protein
MNTSTDIQPQVFIDMLFELDEISAVRIANKWGSDSTDLDRYHAACSVITRQTVFPTCPDCQWPVVSDDPHAQCDSRLESDEDDDGHALTEAEENNLRIQSCCGSPYYDCTCAEEASFRAFHADPATAGSWWTP